MKTQNKCFWLTFTMLAVLNFVALMVLLGFGQLCWLLERWLHPSVNSSAQYIIIGAVMAVGLLVVNTLVVEGLSEKKGEPK